MAILSYRSQKETEVKLPRPTRVKNKTPAPIQITAEQILCEARERRQEAEIRRPPKRKVTDSTELVDYRLRNRKEFEDLIRRVRRNKSVWVKYAKWEESQKDFDRARSVWERALDVDYHPDDQTMWLKYADFEMKNKCINHARNVWDRVVTFLPNVMVRPVTDPDKPTCTRKSHIAWPCRPADVHVALERPCRAFWFT